MNRFAGLTLAVALALPSAAPAQHAQRAAEQPPLRGEALQPGADPRPQSAARSLTLVEALRLAESHAYTNRIARGESLERSASTLEALPGVLPALRVESGWMRTNDPIGAFGTALRHRSISQADFAPPSLNFPAPVETWTASITLEQPLLNLDAHAGRIAASRAADAAREAERWTGASVRLDVVRAYWGAVLAGEAIETLEAAVAAARGHVRQATLMVEQGLATRSDALLAGVKAGEVEAQLVEARSEAELARHRLALLMGTPERTDFSLPSSLPDAGRVRALLVDTVPLAGLGGARAGAASDPAEALERRADVAAARLGASATRIDAMRARSLWLPRLNAFARYDWYSPSGPFEGDEMWSLGLMASWTPFAGGRHLAELRAARGRAAAAAARRDAAEAGARLDLMSTRSRLAVALERLAIAERAVLQSAEAHRIVTHKYEGGLASVVELLDVAAAETKSLLDRSQATYASLVAGAERLRALGRDPGGIAQLDSRTDED